MLERSEFQGVLAYSLAEAIWLARSGIPDVLLGYPTLDHSGFTDLAQDDQLRESIMVVVDSVVHCDIIASAAAGRKIKVCIDIDASLRIGALHVGVRARRCIRPPRRTRWPPRSSSDPSFPLPA